MCYILQNLRAMMEILVFREGADAVEEGFTAKDIPALAADPKCVFWVDLVGDLPERVQAAQEILLNTFGFHPLTVEDAVETRNQPKVEAFPNYLFFIVHGIKPGETGPGNFVTKELDGYLGSNFVVTYRSQRFLTVKMVKQQLRANPYAFTRGAAYVMHQILDVLVDQYMPVVEDFDKAINMLEDRVFELKKSNTGILEDIMDLRPQHRPASAGLGAAARRSLPDVAR
jgi:magnesium transporter